MLQPGQTKFEHAYEVLRSRIESGFYKPGERLNIREITRDVGASDIPVREAVRRLAAEGYVLYVPNVGAMVAQVTLEEIRQLLLVLAALEGVITRLAAPHVSPDILEQLGRIVADQAAAAKREDTEEFSRLNRQFHATIYSVCRVQKLVESAVETQERVDRQKAFSLFRYAPRRMQEAVSEHEQLLALFDQRPLGLDKIEAFSRAHKLQFLISVGTGELAGEVQRMQLFANQP